jgi:nitrogen regulatory protein PII
MKLVTAIIRPEKLDDVIQAATDNGIHGMTVAEVRGFGQQYGQLTSARAAAGQAGGPRVSLLRKVRVDVVVPADQAGPVAEAIAKNAGIGAIGDGKLWISPVDGVVRIRTGERDHNAL